MIEWIAVSENRSLEHYPRLGNMPQPGSWAVSIWCYLESPCGAPDGIILYEGLESVESRCGAVV